ncbi:hypothetical protein BJ546DRAFT_1080218 [Cryomyces antarcticus]|uniref:PD-(D/E)XK nuclease-like domain-containing protein n=1 Tax=Cryomyces antarcticus TaxID=329879 RepID=A0ABR0LQA1_9PEZI|nr:hypothetical protein LTR39_000853 [Cryomyces antarcticus]KAK5018709.1 hypothetical protein LTR60_001388 [Cryomyces antarcticus]KAK5201810.1 hypothetical protein LTR16_001374 [Cryomyces antarcticus]
MAKREASDTILHHVINCWLVDVRSCHDPDSALETCSLSSPTISASFFAHLPPSPLASLQRKRFHSVAFGMEYPSEDTRSITSASTSQASRRIPILDFANRVILEPTPPSKRSTATRSPSPTRKLLTLLEQARPSVNFSQPDGAVAQPQRVVELRKWLSTDLGVGVIPKALKERLRAADPDGFDDVPSSAYIHNDLMTPVEVDRLWEQTRLIYRDARRCNNRRKDESAWVDVVRTVLRTPGAGAGADPTLEMFEIESIQTQQIDPSLLPDLHNRAISTAKKADLALAFSPDDSTVAKALRSASASRPGGTTFSQMMDAYTSTVPLVCGIEVKEAGGDNNEALLQLGIWTAAGLEKLKGLCGGEVPAGGLYPFMGWTVVGHEWKLHLSWMEEDSGRILVVGPFSPLTTGTSTYFDIFKLLELACRLRRWLAERYWPWLSSEVLGVDGQQSTLEQQASSISINPP